MITIQSVTILPSVSLIFFCYPQLFSPYSYFTLKIFKYLKTSAYFSLNASNSRILPSNNAHYVCVKNQWSLQFLFTLQHLPSIFCTTLNHKYLIFYKIYWDGTFKNIYPQFLHLFRINFHEHISLFTLSKFHILLSCSRCLIWLHLAWNCPQEPEFSRTLGFCQKFPNDNALCFRPCWKKSLEPISLKNPKTMILGRFCHNYANLCENQNFPEHLVFAKSFPTIIHFVLGHVDKNR